MVNGDADLSFLCACTAMQEQHFAMPMLKMEGYLITPIQRMPRYELLLKVNPWPSIQKHIGPRFPQDISTLHMYMSQ